MRFSAMLWLLSILPASAMTGNMGYFACPNCYIQPQPMMMPSFFPSYYPWWAPYGAMSYPNFYYPGVWNGGGLWGPSYPGTGPIMAAKPNLYIEAPAGAKFDVKIDLARDSDWLIAVPSRPEQGWSTRVVSTAQNSILEVRGAQYPYFYYDYRLQDTSLQDGKGFCAERERALERMLALLKEYRFADKELRDFERQWTIKLPPLARFCVWPQVDRELQPAAKIVVKTDLPVQIRRVLFVVQDEAILGKLEGKFHSKPQGEWLLAREVAEDARTPASSGAITLREWGIAFIDSSRIKKP